jgi:hypothetical protein
MAVALAREARLHRILHRRQTLPFVFPAIFDYVRALYRPLNVKPAESLDKDTCHRVVERPKTPDKNGIFRFYYFEGSPMPKLKDNSVPTYRLHKQSGQGIVTLDCDPRAIACSSAESSFPFPGNPGEG